MNKRMSTWLVVMGLFFLIPSALLSQQREKILINLDWEFIKSDSTAPGAIDWESTLVEKVNLPHTWNKQDVLDDHPGYFRGIGWYRKTIRLAKGWEQQRIFLEFEAASQVAVIFINGKRIGSHSGGYSGFRFDITNHLTGGATQFELCVSVDNRFNEAIPPLSADFTFFGGIYRDAWIIYAPVTHFSLDHFGGPGVYWQTPVVQNDKAEIRALAFVSNVSAGKTRLAIEYLLMDEAGRTVETKSFKQSFRAGRNLPVNNLSFQVGMPSLWSVDSPVTYKLVGRLKDPRTGRVIDEVSVPVGFRWFEFSADHGFLLNVQPLKVHGLGRHQDYPGMGNALSGERHLEDVRLTRQTGANFLRVAHYPQASEVITACDTAGLLVSVEIPVVNQITESDQFTSNCLLMMEEMIWQNYNHPSVIMWTYMNEVLLRLPYQQDSTRLAGYVGHVAELAGKLEQKARQLDPGRVTMIPNHGAFDRYHRAGLTGIPMVVGWNLYQGWYSSGFSGFGKFLDEHHRVLPGKPLLVTEYGAGHDPRLVTFRPERFDYTAEYALLYHRNYVSEMDEREFVAGGLIWILNDFSSEGRGDAVPNVNSKGICSFDRRPKETYWFYRSIWSNDPFVKIWTPFPSILFSSGKEQAGSRGELQKVDIYTNMGRVDLVLNGTSAGSFHSSGGLIEAALPLRQGMNMLSASIPGSGATDTLRFDFLGDPTEIPTDPAEVCLHVSCGDHRYFWDEETHTLWLPDQPFHEGSWGHMGGEPYRVKTRHGVKPSSDQPIPHTVLDPVYQTQRVNPGQYRFDLPAGTYTVTLLFAELETIGDLDNNPYNLGEDQIAEKFQGRKFGIEVNGSMVEDALDLNKSYGSFYPVQKTFTVEVGEMEGLQIGFLKESGDPVISGIVIRSIDQPGPWNQLP